MAGINIQNFITPATNKVHLLTIVAAVVLFGAFRMSGGTVTPQNNNQHIKRPVEVPAPVKTSVQQPVQAPDVDNVAQQQPLARQPADSVARPFSADSMPGNSGYTRRKDDIDIDNVIDTPAVVRKPPKKKSDALDDIERSLGISF